MEITRSSIDGATAKGPAEWFTGDVYIDSVAAPVAPSRVQGSLVHFMPGARTAWHRHPLGQSLFVTGGIGLCQRRGVRGASRTAGAVGGRGPVGQAELDDVRALRGLGASALETPHLGLQYFGRMGARR